MSLDSDDLDDLAAEYVLGTLSGADRAAFEALLLRDPAVVRAVAAWASRLQPLADAITPAIPPGSLWLRIQREVGLPTRPKLHVRAWIGVAVAAAIVAIVFLFPNLIFKPDVNSIAQLASPQGGATAFVVSVLDDQKKLLIRAAQISEVPNQSYELWVVPAGVAPVSLGVIAATGETERDVAETQRPLLTQGATLAVSLEPTGGSPSGVPTTVMFVGALAPPPAQ